MPDSPKIILPFYIQLVALKPTRMRAAESGWVSPVIGVGKYAL